MHRKQFLGPNWTNKSLAILILLPFVLESQFTLVSSLKLNKKRYDDPKMISTTTDSPFKRFTTPPNSEASKAEIKAVLLDLILFGVNMNNIKKAESMLQSNSIQKMEQDMALLQSIIVTVVQGYGFQPKQKTSGDCVFEYTKEKAKLLQEIAALLNDCKNTIDEVDILHLSKMKASTKQIIYGCSQRTKTIPLDVATLMNKVFHTSYLCTINAIITVVEDFSKEKLLEHIDQNSLLLLKELDYLLNSYIEQVDVNSVQPEENRTESANLSQLNRYKVELAKIKRVVEADVTKRAIQNFTQLVESLVDHNGNAQENNGSVPEKQRSFLQLAKYLKRDLLEKHLKIPDLKDDPIENWLMSQGVNKVIILNNILRSLVTRTAMIIPKSRAIRVAQQDFKEAKLFTDFSTTLGKYCENSPGHLVGTCTPENNEICRNAMLNWGGEGEQELVEVEELHLLPNMVPVKRCICGFRTDCYKARKTKRAACFLVSNGSGQCRGDLGYPCKSHPLESGKYDESCVSGFCNWEKNSCEMNKFENGFREIGWRKVKRVKTSVQEKMVSLIRMFD